MLATLSTRFDEADFSAANVEALCRAMQPALEADGLYSKEAAAMLATWRAAYFQTPGLRLFALVPRAWTDHVLPLKISADCDLERVMVARIELVSGEQRAILDRLRNTTKSDATWISKLAIYGNLDLNTIRQDTSIPADYRDYLALGRFRDALVLSEATRRPTPGLVQFVKAYKLDIHHATQLPSLKATAEAKAAPAESGS